MSDLHDLIDQIRTPGGISGGIRDGVRELEQRIAAAELRISSMSRLCEFVQNWSECRRLLNEARNQYELGVDGCGRRHVLLFPDWYESASKTMAEYDVMAGYDRPVVHGDVMTVAKFLDDCATQCLINYDGFGYPARNGMANPRIEIRPSRLSEIPPDATHIVWFNK